MTPSQETFIKLLHESYSGRGELVNILVKTLDICRESAYKRMRGEVAFSFDEVVLLTKKLNLPINKVFDVEEVNHSSFKLITFDEFDVEDYVKYYYNKVISDNKLLDEKIGNNPVNIVVALNEFIP